MIAARTARMGEPARKVAEIASVAGASVDVDLLREVSGLPEDVVLDAVSELLERRLLREVGRVRFAFVFGHQLIASAIYEEVEEQRRMQLHRRTALAIEKLFGERDEFAAPLAYHYDRAAESKKRLRAQRAGSSSRKILRSNTRCWDYASAFLAGSATARPNVRRSTSSNVLQSARMLARTSCGATPLSRTRSAIYRRRRNACEPTARMRSRVATVRVMPPPRVRWRETCCFGVAMKKPPRQPSRRSRRTARLKMPPER